MESLLNPKVDPEKFKFSGLKMGFSQGTKNDKNNIGWQHICAVLFL